MIRDLALSWSLKPADSKTAKKAKQTTLLKLGLLDVIAKTVPAVVVLNVPVFSGFFIKYGQSVPGFEDYRLTKQV